MKSTAASLLAVATSRLASGASSRLDAELLLASAWQVERSWLVAHLDEVVPAPVEATFQALVDQRADGYPLAYLLGEREFYGRPFTVTPDVLVPRPESEQLVDLALAALTEGDTVLDIGTGSGCLGLTVALEQPGTPVILTDDSPAALTVARDNTARYGVRHVSFVQCDLLPADLPPAKHGIVIANLPYVSEADYQANPDLRHEPVQALLGGSDGLDIIRRLLGQCQEKDWYPKRLLLEIDPRQAAPIRELAWGEVADYKDLAGNTRVVELHPSAL